MGIDFDFKSPWAWFAAPWPTWAFKIRSVTDPGAMILTVPVLWPV